MRIELGSRGAIEAQSWEEARGLLSKWHQALRGLGAVREDSENPHYHYKYVSYNSLAAQVRTALLHNGLSFAFSVDDAESVKDGKSTNVYIQGQLVVMDTETAAVMTLGAAGEGRDSQDKATAKALTAAVKYGWMRAMLSTDQDADPDRDTPKEEAKSQSGPTLASMGEDARREEVKELVTFGKRFGIKTPGEVAQALGVASSAQYNKTVQSAKRDILNEALRVERRNKVVGEGRPQSPQSLRKELRAILAQDDSPMAEPDEYNRVAWAMNLFSDEDRHAITKYLIGKASTKEMTKLEVDTLLQWFCHDGHPASLSAAAMFEAIKVLKEAK